MRLSFFLFDIQSRDFVKCSDLPLSTKKNTIISEAHFDKVSVDEHNFKRINQRISFNCALKSKKKLFLNSDK